MIPNTILLTHAHIIDQRIALPVESFRGMVEEDGVTLILTCYGDLVRVAEPEMVIRQRLNKHMETTCHSTSRLRGIMPSHL